MSQRRRILARNPPTPSNVTSPNTTSRRTSRKPPKAQQSTIWGFIQRSLDGISVPPTPIPTPLAVIPPMQNTPPTVNLSSTLNETPTEPGNPAPSHQTPLLPQTNNQAWGDAWAYNHPSDSFCIISKNVSTLNTQTWTCSQSRWN